MRGAPARFSDALPRSFRENEVIHGRWAMVRLSCIASAGSASSAAAKAPPRLRCCCWLLADPPLLASQLGAAGMLAVELAGQGSWVDAPNWALNGGSPTYLGNSAGVSDLGLLAVIELAAVGFVDKQRTAETGEKRLYPGGSFDPLGASGVANLAADCSLKRVTSAGYAKGDIKELQLKEIKNGRLAMVACLGFFAQGAVTHDGPIAALGKHLADP